MSEVRIEINLDNDAFQGDTCGQELALVLRKMADDLEGYSFENFRSYSHPIRDVNGNRVGFAEFVLDSAQSLDLIEYLDTQKFVRDMHIDDIRMSLVNLCGITTRDGEKRYMLVECLTQCIINDDTTIDEIKEIFNGKY